MGYEMSDIKSLVLMCFVACNIILCCNCNYEVKVQSVSQVKTR